MDKLLYWTWTGASRGESRRGTRKQEERIEDRRQSRINVNADITFTRPDAKDFDRWLGIERKRGDDDSQDS